MGEDPRRHDEEITALRAGIDLGMTVIDTAEAYADGGAEELVGEALTGRREQVFLVSKVAPQHATRQGTVVSCERSLRRLRTDWIDMYLLHWRGRVPLEETVEGLTALVKGGLIRHWGVSNFDLVDLVELTNLPGGMAVETDQVLYNLTHRGIEWDLLPRCREAGLPIMAYSPFEHGSMVDHPILKEVAAGRGITPPQVALAWILRQDGVLTIPKAATPAHVRDNRAAYEVHLTEEDLTLLDRAFPPPNGPRPLGLR
jgi:diketogulonate reductase-like aldo/keto reductase